MNFLNHLSEHWYGTNKKGIEVKNEVIRLLKNARNLFPTRCSAKYNSKAVIVPHAGWNYSGLCAASGYLSFLNNDLKPNINTDLIIILSTYHENKDGIYTFPGSTLKLSNGEKIYVATELIKNFNLPFFKVSNDNSIKNEHSMEIQMPFISYCFPNAKILPLYIGNLNNIQRKKISEILDNIDNLYKTKWVISTDFLHAYSEDYGSNNKYSLASNNFSNHILACEKQFYETLLSSYKSNNIDKKLEELMQTYVDKNGNLPSICGINALKLWCSTNLFQNLMGRLLCYYTSGHLKYDRINNNRLNGNYKISKNFFEPFSHNDGGQIVSYCSISYHEYNNNELDKINLNKTLSRYEELLLLNCARNSIFRKKINLKPLIICPSFKLKKGVFVTLKKNNKLRGCIGTFGTTQTILKNVPNYANKAAYNDSRFDPVDISELPNINISINLLNDRVLINSIDKWKIGIDGIILKSKNNIGVEKSAIFLPSVPTEQNWNKTDTMENLSLKAGFNKDEWKGNNVLIYSIPGYEFEN